MASRKAENLVLICCRLHGYEKYAYDYLADKLRDLKLRAEFCNVSQADVYAAIENEFPAAFILPRGDNIRYDHMKLRALSRDFPELRVFLLDFSDSPDQIQSCYDAGAFAVLTMPMPFERLAKIIEGYVTGGFDTEIPDIADYLRKYGIYEDSKGFYFLCRAIEIVLNDPQAVKGIVKNVYTKIAEEMSTTYTNVDRMIRYVVDRSLETGAIDRLTGKTHTERPLNQKLIRDICDMINTEHKRYFIIEE